MNLRDYNVGIPETLKIAGKPVKQCTILSGVQEGLPCYINYKDHIFRTSTVVKIVEMDQDSEGVFVHFETLNTHYCGRCVMDKRWQYAFEIYRENKYREVDEI